ncbi:unnamed protein product [Kuraishia capsulata CBS 1993]|uniref:Uncharacterized protein n=1 Tax=Kuraishia capsulata CBS 1993 TaxID=1382522 RepID=W6MQU1_9ASCO|nr:uncharacterized protein KUCA_T00004707001 [Kuraishia capsulata CBS 1993]CDK28723.1 unnamed protein product [Kuraishia capsulata CBS 1993]
METATQETPNSGLVSPSSKVVSTKRSRKNLVTGKRVSRNTVRQGDTDGDLEHIRKKKPNSHEVNANTVELKTFTKVVPRAQVQRIWNVISPDLADSIESRLRMLATAVSVEMGGSGKLQSKSGLVLKQLLDDLVPKLQRTKLPPGDKIRDFDVQELQRVKLRLEAELSTSFQQVEALQETLKREERALKRAEAYKNNFSRNAAENIRLLEKNEGNLMKTPPVISQKSISSSAIDLRHELSLETDEKRYNPSNDEEIIDLLRRLDGKIGMIYHDMPSVVELTDNCSRLGNLVGMVSKKT